MRYNLNCSLVIGAGIVVVIAVGLIIGTAVSGLWVVVHGNWDWKVFSVSSSAPVAILMSVFLVVAYRDYMKGGKPPTSEPF